MTYNVFSETLNPTQSILSMNVYRRWRQMTNCRRALTTSRSH